MPRDLFTQTSASTTAPASRRPSLLFASVTAHVLGLAAVIFASILLPDVLPRPHAASLEWDPTTSLVKLEDIPLPPKAPVRVTRPVEPTAGDIGAPTEAPNGLPPEELAAVEPEPLERGLVTGNAIGETLAAPPPPPPAPPKPESQTAVRVSGGVEAPRQIYDVAPVYPVLAHAAGAQGIVIIEATIDVDGNVVATKVLRSVPLLDAAAVDAVRQWKYAPARLNGEAVAVLFTVTVNFVLGR